MDGLRQLVEAYVPYNEQEERDRELILEQIDSGRDILTRNNKNAHITVSGWVVSPDRKGSDGLPQYLPLMGLAGRPCGRR